MSNERVYPKVDLARLAAFIDGEGSIRIKQRGGRGVNKGYYMEVVVVNTDPRLMVWLRDTFGGAAFVRKGKRRRPNHKVSYRWQATAKMGYTLLKACYPYLIIKREQAEVAFAFQSTLRGPGVSTPPEILKQREQFAQEITDLKWKVFDHESLTPRVSADAELVN